VTGLILCVCIPEKVLLLQMFHIKGFKNFDAVDGIAWDCCMDMEYILHLTPHF
jgi:hypothetical protein